MEYQQGSFVVVVPLQGSGYTLPVIILVAYKTILDGLLYLVYNSVRVGVSHDEGLGACALLGILLYGKSSPFYRGKHPFIRLLSMGSEAIVSQMSVSEFATCTLKALPLRHETNHKSTIVNQ